MRKLLLVLGMSIISFTAACAPRPKIEIPAAAQANELSFAPTHTLIAKGATLSSAENPEAALRARIAALRAKVSQIPSGTASNTLRDRIAAIRAQR